MNSQHGQNSPQEPSPISTRATPPRPRRLSRKALATLSGTGICLIAAALTYSLGTGTKGEAPRENVAVDGRQSDLLASAPKDYSELAERAAGGIGPPPSARAEPEPAPQNIPSDASSTGQRANAAHERRRAQEESARGSRLFAASAERASGPAVVSAAAAPSNPVEIPKPNAAGSTNDGRITSPRHARVLSAGSTISAALITGLSSDLPGQVVAQVTEDVFDSATGQFRLIPQGSRLIGSYDSNVGYRQTRALFIWTRLIFPDGRSMDLDRLVGTDAAGRSGITDRVDDHWGTMLRAGALSTLLGLGAATSELSENGQIANAIRDSAGQTIGRAGDRIAEKQLGVQPTITVRPGARVKVLVSRDLLFDAPTGE